MQIKREKMKGLTYSISLILLPLFLNAQADSTLDTLADDLKTTSTLSDQTHANIDYKPYILTVFNANDLLKMGVSTLEEALKLVPGVDIATNTMNFHTPIFRSSNPLAYGQSKLAINGIIVNELFFDGYNHHLNMPIQLIERIEVVRGPGSFISGVHGYAGTINVITKAANPKKTPLSGEGYSGAGSDHKYTIGGWSRYEGTGWSIAADAHWIENDAKSATSVTDFLGYTDTAKLATEKKEASLSLNTTYLNVTGRVTSFESDGAFGNLNAIPDDNAHLQTPSWYLHAQSTLPITHDLSLSLQGKIQEDTWQSDAQSLPANSCVHRVTKRAYRCTDPAITSDPASFVPYADGFWAFLKVTGRHTNFNSELSYNGLENHHIRAGFTLFEEKVVDSYTITNKITPSSIIDISHIDPFFKANDAQREGSEYYLSDSIEINDEIAMELTGGIVQVTHAPSEVYYRGAIVYQPTFSDIFKLMGGHSYRLPSFQEMYIAPSPYGTGNPNLTPEQVSSIETQYIHHFSSDLSSALNLFYIYNNDQITRNTQTNIFQNIGCNHVYGAEAELRGSFFDNDNWLTSYSYTHTKTLHGSQVPGVTSHLFKLAYSYDLSNALTLGSIFHYVGEKTRHPQDNRPVLDPYMTLDLSLGWNLNLSRGWYIQASVKNIGDTTVRYPSIPNTYNDDYPIGDRTYWFQSGWRF